MKKLTILIVCLLALSQAKAQFTVAYNCGYGSYDMGNLKDRQKELIERWIPAKDAIIEDNFSGGMTHDLSIGYKFNIGYEIRHVYAIRHVYEVGVKSSYYGTKGRFHSKVDPNNFHNQFDLDAYRVGIYFKDYFYNDKWDGNTKFSLFYEVSPGMIFSKIDQEGFLRVSTNRSHTNKVFAIMAQLGARYHITPHIGANVSVGYDFSPGTDNYEEVKVNDKWSGIRIAAGISYTL